MNVLIVNKKIVDKGSKKYIMSKLKSWRKDIPTDKVSIGLSVSKKIGDIWE